ncbi:MAG TPA: efflux RND transporter permease subunit, partial [Myxococcaceae bacterium]|nr:efflux RND transporter permease subunit [Myxococcaceae bacterium]
VLADVKSAVDRITSFPEDAERPTVSLLSRRRQVISLIISGDQELRTLQAIGEKARSELLELPDITQVDLVGVRPLEVAIEIPQEKLEAYGLSLDEVARQVAAASVELPGGGVKTRGGELLVRVSDRRRFAHEFSSIILRGTAQGAQVRLGDIATLEDGYAETDQASYFNGKPAVRLTTYRVGDETPIEVAGAVRAYAERLRAELPSNISVDIWADDSEVLAARIDLLMRNAQTGLLLVFLVLALFLQLRLAFWVALGIPISFLGTFLLMPALGLSINMVTLFAFIIVLGMVVDDAIVVGENVYARMEAGEGLMEAAIKGSKEMAVPVTFSILTTVAAFSPLFFVPGVTGKIFGLIPWVVVTVLLISLVEAFFILPAHLGHGAPGQKKGLALAVHRAQQRVSNGLNRFGERVYRPVLEVTLRHRYVTLCAAVAMLLMTVGMVASGRVPFTFFPKLEGDVVKATARLPYGAPLERTLAVRESLEASARAALAESGGERILRGMFTRVGESDSGEVGSHLVTVELNLVPGEEREVGAEALAAAWSRLTPPQAGLESLTFNSSVGPGAGRPVDVQLSHPDTEVLARASASLTETLRAFPALRDVENAYSQGKPQLDFRLLPQARTLGLTAGEVGRQLRSSFFGAEALREQRGRNEVKVMVRLPESQRRSEFDVERLLIRTPAGGRVPLSYVASFERGRSPTVIRREDGMRVVNVSAELAAGAKSPQEVLDSLKAEVLPKLKAEFPRLQADLVGQQRAQAETFGSLG